MNTKPEIKAGQRWKVNKGDNNVTVLFADEQIVTLFGDYGYFIESTSRFVELFSPLFKPKTRPVTKDDVLKMLAVNPVLFVAGVDDEWRLMCDPEEWIGARTPHFDEYRFSHNPFAEKQIIVGPEIEVVE